MKPTSSNAALTPLYDALKRVRRADYFSLKKRLDGLARKPGTASAKVTERLAQAMAASIALRDRRQQSVPPLQWPDLPVVSRRDDIKAAIRDHQVVVIAGETGSGKTTQLPKICLELGRGIDGTIGHTQPRRLAARAVAQRLAEELDSQLGDRVGYKVRFDEQVGENSLIKVLTDGMLLNEIQQDRFLNQYDTIIIDEAHERSLNIDFLLGYLRQLLPRRPDLKLIITSATIDHQRFAEHFAAAPVLEVSGRSFPVDIHYRPPLDGQDLARQVEAVLHDIEQLERGHVPPARDVLVFLAGERDIRDVHHHLKRCDLRDTEVLPLYARLSRAEQQRIFMPHRGRRVVLSTNVAETSLTVPGIRYVIDAGTARISRYSVHSKVQRLPIEPISQASANQRAGRSGRLMPGVAFRLYEEDDFQQRPAYTDPEIQRTNLAAVILQMAHLRLGRVDEFPFIDAPDGRLIRDGYRLLAELGAIDGQRHLTPLGRQLATFPLDPTLARILVAANEKRVLHDALIVVSALAAQDPRERPQDKQQQADQAHQPFTDKQSDFLFFVHLWQWAEQQRAVLSRNQYEKRLKKQFLSPLRMREWRDIHRQLLLLAKAQGWPLDGPQVNTPADITDPSAERPKALYDNGFYDRLHQALLPGLLGNVMQRTDDGEWLSSRNRKPLIWPGSGLAKTKARWLIAAEQIETSRLFARLVARIEPEWVEEAAAHLVKRQYHSPRWSKKRGCVMAREQVNLFGLILSAGRPVHYGPIEPELCRELMVREGLVMGQVQRVPAFLKENSQRIEALIALENKLRRRDIVVDEDTQVGFYLARLPEDMYTLAGLMAWWNKRASEAQKAALLMSDDDLLARDPSLAADDYPDQMAFEGFSLPLRYQFDPTGATDGVTLTVPLAVLGQVPQQRLDWLVPGLLRDKLEALIRALPKARRRHFVPVPDYVAALMSALTPGEPLLPAMTRELQRITGVRIEQEEWQEQQLPDYLRLALEITDDAGEVIASGRSLDDVQQALSGMDLPEAAAAPASEPEQLATDWQFGELPEVAHRQFGNMTLQHYPALQDRGNAVARISVDQPMDAEWQHQWGCARLVALRMAVQVRDLRKQAGSMAGFQKLKAAGGYLGQHGLDDCLLRIIVTHFKFAELPVRSEDAFRQRLDQHRASFVPYAQKQLVRLADMFSQFRSLSARLDKNFPLAWAHAHRDIKQQLQQLFFDQSLRQVDSEWLNEYPRYLSAIEHRLEKIGGQINKDRAAVAEINAHWDQYLSRAGKQPLWQQPVELRTYRWMIEEYRVSLFAQSVGTRMPVSAKRLNKLWQLC